MKTLFHLHALVLSLFLFAFTITTTLARSSSNLRDVRRQPLQNGGLYYIFPVNAVNGGGLELARTGRIDRCPSTVVQARSSTSKGLPARLASPAKIPFLRSNLFLNIEFQLQNSTTVCQGHSTLRWTVWGRSQIVKVILASSEDEEEALTGPFKIQPYRGFYKLVYCERDRSVDNRGGECRDLGISVDKQENRRLVVKDGEPLRVVFINADGSGDDDEGPDRMSIV